MPIYVINSIVILNYPVTLSHRRSTTISLETNPFYHLISNRYFMFWLNNQERYQMTCNRKCCPLLSTAKKYSYTYPKFSHHRQTSNFILAQGVALQRKNHHLGYKTAEPDDYFDFSTKWHQAVFVHTPWRLKSYIDKFKILSNDFDKLFNILRPNHRYIVNKNLCNFNMQNIWVSKQHSNAHTLHH